MYEELGPAAMGGATDSLVEYIVAFLDKKTFCQTKLKAGEAAEDLEDCEEGADEYGEEESDDDDVDHDEIIFGNVSDIIICMSRAMGNEFAGYFNVIAPHLAPYTNESRPKSDRCVAIGCMSEVFASCESVIPHYFEGFVQLIEKHSHSKDSKLNRNVAYSVGVLAQHA
jgi:hypothetical protein